MADLRNTGLSEEHGKSEILDFPGNLNAVVYIRALRRRFVRPGFVI